MIFLQKKRVAQTTMWNYILEESGGLDKSNSFGQDHLWYVRFQGTAKYTLW